MVWCSARIRSGQPRAGDAGRGIHTANPCRSLDLPRVFRMTFALPYCTVMVRSAWPRNTIGKSSRATAPSALTW